MIVWVVEIECGYDENSVFDSVWSTEELANERVEALGGKAFVTDVEIDKV